MAHSDVITLPVTKQQTSMMVEHIRLARREETFMDFKIRIKNDSLSCNKLILAAHSPIMKAMLKSGMTEVQNQELKLETISVNIMNIILDYMYCCEVRINKDQLMALTAATDYLQMTGLKEFCLAEIKATLKPTNVLPWWKEANTLGLTKVVQQCEEMMASRISVISTQADFLALNRDQIRLYMGYICDDCTQADDILEAIMRWVSHDTNNRLSFLEEILRHVDVHKCSTECIKMVKRTYASTVNKQSMAKDLLELLLMEALIGRKALMLTHDLCIIGGQYSNRSQPNPFMRKISKSHQVEKMSDISYEGFACVRQSVCKTPQGFVITGDASSSQCNMYISAEQLWKRMPDLPQTLCAHGSICVQQTIYVCGGCNCGIRMQCNSVYMISPNYARWQTGPYLPLSVKFPKVAEVDDSVYLLDEESSQLVQLHVESRKWRKRASLPWKEPNCFGLSMTSAKGQLYVAGGYRKQFVYYRPCIDTWCLATPPLLTHAYGSLVYHKDKLILLGGNFKGAGSDDVEEYSFEEETWSLCSYKMPPGLFQHCGLVLNIPKTDSEHADNFCSLS